MNQIQFSGYIGNFKQPLQKPEAYRPTIYALSDYLRNELALILLTPGTYLHAYKYIKRFNPKSVKLFTPTLRIEMVSDIFNLYMNCRDGIPIEWVYPIASEHYDFDKGLVKSESYINTFDVTLGISYVKNDNVEDVYDIVVHDNSSVRYFTQYLTQEQLDTLYENPAYSTIELPYTSTMYGGLSYFDIKTTCKKKYLTKLVPHSFSSIDEYELCLEMGELEKGKVIYIDFI